MPDSQSKSYNIFIYLFVIFLTIVNVNNIKISGLSYFFPLFDLMSIFYFAVFHNFFGFFFIFLVGIWHDSINNISLGTTSLCYILAVKLFLIINDRMILKESFAQIWQQFIFFCFLFLLLKWLIISLSNKNFLSISPVFIQGLISVIAYGFFHRFLDFFVNKIQQ